MQRVRWRHVSLVFQGAMNSLDPVQRIDAQIAEAIRLHESAGSKQVRDRIGELLETVGLTPGLGRRYAHQLSGGQRQRVMIALALACRPVAGDRRRADHRARRRDAGAGAPAPRTPAGAARAGADPDLPRPRRARRDLRSDRDHVRGPDRRVRAGADRVRRPPAPVHEAPARLAAGDRRPAGTRRPDPGRAARPRRAARGLPLPAALSLRRRALPHRPRSCASSARASPRPVTSRRGASGRRARAPARRSPHEHRRAADGGPRPRGPVRGAPRGGASARRRLARVAPGRDPRRGGRVGLRQVDPCPRDARPAAPRRGLGVARRRRSWRARRASARCAGGCR